MPETVDRRPETALSEQSAIEWMWKQVAQSMGGRDSVQVRQHDLDVARKLPQNLTTRPTGWSRGLRVGHDHDTTKLAVTFGKSFEDCDAFRTDGQAVSGVLDVATSEDGAVPGFESCAHLEPRILRQRAFASRAGGGDERIRSGQ